jgi:PAS domain-containing protein
VAKNPEFSRRGAGLIGGYPAGLLATALSIPMADYFSLEPVGESGITNPVDVQTVVVFTLSCVLVTGVNKAMHRARARAATAEAELALSAERERAAMKISESERRYRSLFENMLDGFAYCRMLFDDRGTPADFVYLDVNAAFAKMTGVADAVGKKVTEVFPGIKESNPGQPQQR